MMINSHVSTQIIGKCCTIDRLARTCVCVLKTGNEHCEWCESEMFCTSIFISCFFCCLFFIAGTCPTYGSRSFPASPVREASVLLHGHDPVCHQQSEEPEDDTERHLHVDRGPFSLLQRGGQTRMEGALVSPAGWRSRWVYHAETCVKDSLLFICCYRIQSAITSPCTTCSFERRHQTVKFLSGPSDPRRIDASHSIRSTRWAHLHLFN